jgi:3,4-dihydroxy 2-butanone 4-phosphate synthase
MQSKHPVALKLGLGEELVACALMWEGIAGPGIIQYVGRPISADGRFDVDQIVCLCLTEEKVRTLKLPMMVKNNSCRFRTAYTVSIDGSEDVTTGVSAHDRVTTIKTAVADNAKPQHLHRPGHIFPLKSLPGGVLERSGHTEATVDLVTLAGLKPYGVLCELTNTDGTMARLSQIVAFAGMHDFPVLTIEDLKSYRKAVQQQAG